MKTKTMKLKDLKPADYNPRAISDAALSGLKNSIERFGMVQPIIVNERTGNIVGGHQRLKAMQELGIKDTEVITVDLDEIHEKALNVSLNNSAIAGTFTDGLQDLLSDIECIEPEMIGDLCLEDLKVDAGQLDEVGFDGAGEKKTITITVSIDEYDDTIDSVRKVLLGFETANVI